MSVRALIGPFASPGMIIPTGALPMTRSGKIMRQILRKIACRETVSMGDITKLLDPSIVDELIVKVKKFHKTKM